MTVPEPPPAPAPVPPPPYPRRWAAAGVMMAAALMDLLDVTIVNVAIPSIGRDRHASQSALQWLVSAYLLGFAATLIVSGHLGDRYGRKVLFLAGTAGFGLASLGCGIAQSPTQLITARAVQGVMAALLMPQVLGSFRTLFQGKERGAAFGMYGAVAGFASAVGLLLGGLLTDADLFGWGWRSVFLVNVPIALAACLAGAVLVPTTRERGAGRPDLAGSLVLAAALIAIVLPLVQGEANGWPLWGWLCLAAGVLAVTGLGVLEGRRRGTTVPLLPARAFRMPAFSVGLAVQLLFSVGMQGFFLIFAIWLQGSQGYTPMQAGVLTIAFSVGNFLTAPAADALAVRFGRLVLAAGALLMAGGFAGIWYAVAASTGASTGASTASAAAHAGAWPLVPGLLVAGAGLGFLVVPLVNVVLSAVPADIAGGASGIFSTAQQFGGALGAALIGSVFFGALADGDPTHALTTAMPWVSAGFLLSAVLCLALPRAAVSPGRSPPTPNSRRCDRHTQTAPAPWREVGTGSCSRAMKYHYPLLPRAEPQSPNMFCPGSGAGRCGSGVGQVSVRCRSPAPFGTVRSGRAPGRAPAAAAAARTPGTGSSPAPRRAAVRSGTRPPARQSPPAGPGRSGAAAHGPRPPGGPVQLPFGERAAAHVRLVRLGAGEPGRRVLAEQEGAPGEDVAELLWGEVTELLVGELVLAVRVEEQPAGPEEGGGGVGEDFVVGGGGEAQVQPVQQDVGDLVRQCGRQIAAVGAEAVVDLDEVLRTRGQFHGGGLFHRSEADHHPGVGQPQGADDGGGHAVGAEVEVVGGGEGGVGGREARAVGADPLVREPPEQCGDGGADGVEVRKSVLDRVVAPAVSRHAALRAAPCPKRRP